MGKVDPKSSSQELFVKGAIFPGATCSRFGQSGRKGQKKGLDKVDQKEGHRR